jgi:frataxin-like iron-binding protein CyaY
VEEFHRKIETLMKNLLEIMDHVKEFEIDFRNWHDILKMKGLQKRLDNITKKDTYEKSIVTKRIGL